MSRIPFIVIMIFISGCSTVSDYAKNILSDPRNDQLVYKTDKDYSSSQVELILPPDVSQPNTKDALTLPEIVNNNTDNLFTVDSNLENIKIYKQGKDTFLSVITQDKLELWNRIKLFWKQEGFQIINEDITIASLKTNYLENLSEAQLGTVQRLVGRYLPVLVSPETRDSYTTRLIKKDNGYDVVVTHYGKEFMSDGDTEFRWQNRPRDTEYENEMISRMFIYLGGDEARDAGLIVAKATGVRNNASIYTDEQGLQTLFVPDIYERVYPSIVSSLEVLGVSIIENDQSEGIIKISLQDKDASTNSFFGNLFGGNSSEELNINVDLTDQGKATLITIENNSYTRVNTPASEEVLRGLYVKLR